MDYLHSRRRLNGMMRVSNREKLERLGISGRRFDAVRKLRRDKHRIPDVNGIVYALDMHPSFAFQYV